MLWAYSNAGEIRKMVGTAVSVTKELHSARAWGRTKTKTKVSLIVDYASD